MLYVMTERWPAARKYRDVFEQIKTSVTDVIVKGNHQATRAAGILDAEMTERCRALDQSLPGGARTDYSQMISDMASERGRPIPDGKSDTSRLQFGATPTVQGRGHNPRIGIWPGTILDNGLGSLQMPNFTDVAFMSGLEDFEGLAEWDLAIWDGANSFN
jgi:hypothetical protein